MLPPPPIQGVGNAAGVTMQVELRDGSFDLGKLQAIVNAVEADAQSQSSIQRVMASFRANVPQYVVEVDRVKTETLQLTVDQVFSALTGYLGSAYVDQFNKFGRTFQIYVQADAQFRLRLEDVRNLTVRNKARQHDPARHADHHHADGRAVADQPLQSLSVGHDRGAAGGGRVDRTDDGS